MSCPRRWVTVLDGAPVVDSVRQQLALVSHTWVTVLDGVNTVRQQHLTLGSHWVTVLDSELSSSS